jgi:signal transduction histidine kinase
MPRLKIRSFRLRIALMLTVLAGMAIAGFGIASWLLIYQAKLTRLDTEITSQLVGDSTIPHPEIFWKTYITTLTTRFGWVSSSDIALIAIHDDGDIIYQSANWSTDWNHLITFPPLPDGQRPFHPLPPDLPPDPPPDSILRELDNPPPLELSKLFTKHNSSGYWRIGTVASPRMGIAIAVNLQAINNEMGIIGNIFFISVPGVMILVAIGAWLISASALKPLQQVTATIRRVTVKGLDQRIPIKTIDVEFIEMLQVFNQMMERLDRSFKQASRFSADAAHELKTPLAILQGELERNLHQAPLGSELQQNLSNLLDQVRRLGVIVRKLLLLSLADAGQMRLHKVKTDLSSVLQDLVEDIEILAPELEVKINVPANLPCAVDLDLLLQVLHNLIDNGIKYNLPQGWIKIKAGFLGNCVAISFSNSSNDIPPEHRQQIFNRFHRGDLNSTHRIAGVGIGLSLSREIARAHGGDLTLDRTPSGTTTFTLTLPV